MLLGVIRTVIFDLDGTLVHSLPGIANSLNRVLAAANLPTHPESVVRRFIGNGIYKLVERAAPSEGADTLNTLTDAMRADYAQTWQQGTAPYPGVTETLEQLAAQSIPCAVFSNKPDEYCRTITDLLFPRFSFALVRGQLPDVPAKPDPAGALNMCNEIETPLETTALVGDSTIDIETARNAGMISIAATWGYHDPDALAATEPQHTIDSMEELLAILNI